MLLYVNSPIHIDALKGDSSKGDVDFQNIVVHFPPQLPPRFPVPGYIYVYSIILFSFWNAVVWIGGTALIGCMWPYTLVWDKSLNHLMLWLLGWEVLLIVRGASRKIITALVKAPHGSLLPVGMGFDLVIWNPITMVASIKMATLSYPAEELADALDLRYESGNAVAWTVFIIVWTTLGDCIVRFAWPGIYFFLANDFRKGAAASLVWALPKTRFASECCICLETSDNLCVLQCSHFFHGDCLLKWYHTAQDAGLEHVRNTCPLCNQRTNALGGSRVVFSGKDAQAVLSDQDAPVVACDDQGDEAL